MMPDLPIPVRIRRPVQFLTSATASSNRPSSRGSRARIAAASVSSTFFASERSATLRDLTALHDCVNSRQSIEKRLEQIELQRVLAVALRLCGIFVNLEKQ